MHHARIQRGDRGSRPPLPPLKNHKNIGYLSNTGPDPLKNHKATNGGPLRARLSSPPPSSTKKNLVKVRPHLTKLPGSAHVHMISGVILRWYY